VLDTLSADVRPHVRPYRSTRVADLGPLADVAVAVLPPLVLEPGEAFAVITNNPVSTGHAALAIADAARLLDALSPPPQRSISWRSPPTAPRSTERSTPLALTRPGSRARSPASDAGRRRWVMAANRGTSRTSSAGRIQGQRPGSNERGRRRCDIAAPCSSPAAFVTATGRVQNRPPQALQLERHVDRRPASPTALDPCVVRQPAYEHHAEAGSGLGVARSHAMPAILHEHHQGRAAGSRGKS
jgi:hypothetical protein